ncbi:MAG: transglutaminase-like domain-containing protein [Bythopirellula sp.]|nr:transglutaminase-like domain-containing protein [Bythopirellula sp.]
METPTYCRALAFRRFEAALAQIGTAQGLFRAAFAISLHERPEANLGEAESIVEQLSATVQQRVRSNSTAALLAHLHDVLFDVFGLRGNTEDYYNPANSYVSDVLSSRRGLPISLVLIYKRVAEPLGLVVHGVNSPGHFLAEVASAERTSEKSMYVDPFFGGELLTAPEVFARISQATGQDVIPSPELLSRATPEQWLARMLTNLQAAFSAAGQERNTYAMQELYGLLQV